MSVYRLKPHFQDVLRPAVGGLAAAGITANHVTLAAAGGSVAVGAFVGLTAPSRWPFLLLPLWLFLRMALNAIDGMLAREFGQKSRLGAYLNELGDVVSDVALYVPFAFLPALGWLPTTLIIVLAGLSEMAGALGPTIGASRRYEGPMGKSDRALVFGAAGVWIGLGGPLPLWSDWLMLAVAALVAATIANRVRAGLAEAAARS